MKITVITQHFEFGGLETQILGYARCLLKRGHDVSFVVGSDSRLAPLRDLVGNRILSVDFRPPLKGHRALGLIEKIAHFCRERKTEVLHLHPFITSTLGALAAARLSLPFLLTLHGPGNLDVALNPPEQQVLDQVVLREAAMVFCVSRELVELARSRQTAANCVWLPNGIDVERFAPLSATPGGDWAVVSRMDARKVHGIKHILEKLFLLPDRGFQVRLFGDGPERVSLADWVARQPFRQRVKFEGISWNLPADLPRSIAGGAGQARALLELAAMGLPTILVNEEGVKGLLRPERMSLLQASNFSGRDLPNLGKREFLDQMADLVAHPASYYLRPWVIEHANEEIIWDRYLQLLNTLGPSDYTLSRALLKRLARHPRKDLFARVYWEKKSVIRPS